MDLSKFRVHRGQKGSPLGQTDSGLGPFDAQLGDQNGAFTRAYAFFLFTARELQEREPFGEAPGILRLGDKTPGGDSVSCEARSCVRNQEHNLGQFGETLGPGQRGFKQCGLLNTPGGDKPGRRTNFGGGKHRLYKEHQGATKKRVAVGVLAGLPQQICPPARRVLFFVQPFLEVKPPVVVEEKKPQISFGGGKNIKSDTTCGRNLN